MEAVNPVVLGQTRAKQFFHQDKKRQKVVPILIHGDASIAGQGVVYEVIQMQDLKGYKTGGTIHLVINNQLGFTTDYLDARSSTYCTDVAKTTLSSVFHVNKFQKLTPCGNFSCFSIKGPIFSSSKS